MRAWFALLLVPLVGAQALVLEDASGDVEAASYGQTLAPPGDWSPVDLVSLQIEETADELRFIVGVERLSSCDAGQCLNAGDLRTYFRYGDTWYYVQQGMDPVGNAYAQLAQVAEGQVQGQTVSGRLGATFDRDANTVIADVPRELIVDSKGTPPLKGRLLDGFHTRSYSQYSLGGPEIDGEDDMLVVRDRMGFEERGIFTLAFGGSAGNGPVEVSSPQPYRASNGGAATYRYDIAVAYDGERPATFNVSAVGLPSLWTFERPAGDLSMAPGERRTFPVLVSTPAGHQHGGADVFQVRLDETADTSIWAEVDLGVHYLQVPQPAGHHPRLYFHSLTDGVLVDVLTVFGPDGGRLWMNTLEEDPGDEGVPIVGREGAAGFLGQRTEWSVCLIPNLRLGLDFDVAATGRAEVFIGASTLHQDVTVTGRLLHLDGPEDLDFCDPAFYGGRNQTVLATLDGAPTVSLLGSTERFDLTVTPTPESDIIPFTPGAQLVLELTATFTGGDPGPGGLSLYPDGVLELPLLEYRDGRPAGFLGDAADLVEEDLGSFTTAETSKGSPGPTVGVGLALLAGVRSRRAAGRR